MIFLSDSGKLVYQSNELFIFTLFNVNKQIDQRTIKQMNKLLPNKWINKEIIYFNIFTNAFDN